MLLLWQLDRIQHTPHTWHFHANKVPSDVQWYTHMHSKNNKSNEYEGAVWAGIKVETPKILDDITHRLSARNSLKICCTSPEKHTKCPSLTCGHITHTRSLKLSTKSQSHSCKHRFIMNRWSQDVVLTFLSWVGLEKQTERQKDTPHLHYRKTLTQTGRLRAWKRKREIEWACEGGGRRWSLLAAFMCGHDWTREWGKILTIQTQTAAHTMSALPTEEVNKMLVIKRGRGADQLGVEGRERERERATERESEAHTTTERDGKINKNVCLVSRATV